MAFIEAPPASEFCEVRRVQIIWITRKVGPLVKLLHEGK